MSDQRILEDLKIACLSQGAKVTKSALAWLGGAANVTVHEYATTGGLPIKVGGLDINVPFDEWYSARSDVEIGLIDDELVVSLDGKTLAIEQVYPLPEYLDRTSTDGRRLGDVVYTHIDRVRISPISGCAYDCAFCDLPGRITLHPLPLLLEALDVALEDERFDVRHVLVSGGSPGPRQEDAFADTLHAIVDHLAGRIEVDVMMAASAAGPGLVRRLVDAGVHGFALNLEIFSGESGQIHIKRKHRRSQPHLDETIGTAVELLGSTGKVRSLILPGLEPVDQTLAGVDYITSLGADPVLSPFRPARGTALAHHEPVSPGVLRDVLDGSREIVAGTSVRLGPRCLPCQHNTLSFPWDVS